MPNSVAGGARPAATSPTPGPLKILDLTFGPQQAGSMEPKVRWKRTPFYGEIYIYIYIYHIYLSIYLYIYYNWLIIVIYVLVYIIGW